MTATAWETVIAGFTAGTFPGERLVFYNPGSELSCIRHFEFE